VAGAFERLGELGQMRGDLARDAGRGRGIGSSASGSSQTAAGGRGCFVAQVGEPDAVRARVGERRVGGAGAGEVGVQLDDVADIDHDQEGRPAFVGRQGAGVVFGLAAGAQHGVVEARVWAPSLIFLASSTKRPRR
jgi:hypothetical protein